MRNNRYNKKYNNNRRRNKRNPVFTNNPITRQIKPMQNLFNKTNGVTVNITAPAIISSDSTSALYTLGSSTDVRFFTFASVLTGSSAFGFLNDVYTEYRIVSASLLATPYMLVSQTNGGLYPMLYVTCDPEITSSSNPSNSIVITDPLAHVFTPVANQPRTVTFRFPGTGLSTNVWLTGTTIAGAFYLGNNSSGFPTGFTAVFDCSFSLCLQFRNFRSH